jgi:CheY-like chemotaxis protein
MLREIYGLWLEIAGCKQVYTSDNGESALALLESVDVDLLITDIRMPKMDGITLVRHIATLQKPIPSILFVSGFGDINLREMYDLGVEAFLSKPLPRDQLIQSVELALSARSGLWLEPMGRTPAQSIDIMFESIHGGNGKREVEIGRGGFSIQDCNPLMRGAIAFRCGFTAEHQELSGQGYVRWSSKTDNAVGIEFGFLDPRCRSWVLDEIAVNHPQSFIPGSMDPISQASVPTSSLDRRNHPHLSPTVRHHCRLD